MGITLAAIALFVFADRFSGGGFFWDKLAHDHGGPLRGRPLYYATVIAALALFLLTKQWEAATLALAFAVWRLPGWKIGNHGGIDPKTTTDIAYVFVRHLLAAVIVIPAHFLLNWEFGVPLFAAPMLFAAGATVLAALQGKGKITNGATEMARGALFGAMVGYLLV
jgi:hypothetical protein